MMPGMPPGDEKLLVTSNDSKVRLYNMKDKSLMFKYKGVENTCLQIKASFRYRKEKFVPPPIQLIADTLIMLIAMMEDT